MTSVLAVPSPMSASMHVCVPLEADVDVERVGGKAHTLGRMIRGGVRVPPGFTLCTTALDAHLCAAGIEDEIRVLCAAAERGAASATIRAMVSGATMPESIREELMECAAPLLASGPVVVRSSAVGEDSAEASFAGQLDSVLHVADESALEHAVLACWASFWSERALFYRSARRMESAGMGVVVQLQVDARAAGVMFTDNGAGALLVEYTAGLADALVAGAVDPGRITIDRLTGGITHDGARGAEVDLLVGSRRCVVALLDTASSIEATLGAPQDVEWAIGANDVLYVVQARPITAPLVVSRKPDAGRHVVWSNANVNENFPAPISPLLYSVASAGYTHYFRNLGRAFGIAPDRLAAMEPAFARIIGVHGGRMYYNLTNIHAVIRLAPFGQTLAAAFDTFVGARDEAPHADAVPTRRPLAEVAEVMVIGARAAWQYLSMERRIRRFEGVIDSFATRSHPERLARSSLQTLRGLLAEFMDIRCHGWKDASLADTAAMVCYAALQRLVAHAYPGGAEAAHTSLLKAIPDVVSNEPVHRLWALSRLIRGNARLADMVEHADPASVLDAIASDAAFGDFRKAFDEYLEDWGFRCSSELMLTTPSFQEEPEPVIAMLRAYARLDADSPVQSMARQSLEREAEVVRARTALGVLAPLLRVLLSSTYASIRYRERARLKQALLYSRLRRIALAMGDALVTRDLLATRTDVFWLTVSELDELASGGAMFPHGTRELVSLRSRAHAAFADVTQADSFSLGEGEYLDAGMRHEREAVDVNATRLRGITACVGRVTGRASVLVDVSEAERLEEGDVLVTKQTDPGWGPVFFLISGLVIERGGMLSHGAILAREFGIPCVVGVREATRVIPNGAELTVDADSGCVHVRR